MRRFEVSPEQVRSGVMPVSVCRPGVELAMTISRLLMTPRPATAIDTP